MITLQLKLRKNGFWYNQVHRDGQSCIYEQMVCEKLSYFEVFEVQIKPERNVFGRVYPLMEVFPHDKAFGQTAWSCRTIEAAMIRFKKLEESES